MFVNAQEVLATALMHLKGHPSRLEPLAQGDTPFFVFARPHSLDGPQATVCKLIFCTVVGWRKRLDQIHIAIGAAGKSRTVPGFALRAKHNTDEFTTTMRRRYGKTKSGPVCRELLASFPNLLSHSKQLGAEPKFSRSKILAMSLRDML
jgi:hypothetical protein